MYGLVRKTTFRRYTLSSLAKKSVIATGSILLHEHFRRILAAPCKQSRSHLSGNLSSARSNGTTEKCPGICPSFIIVLGSRAGALDPRAGSSHGPKRYAK